MKVRRGEPWEWATTWREGRDVKRGQELGDGGQILCRYSRQLCFLLPDTDSFIEYIAPNTALALILITTPEGRREQCGGGREADREVQFGRDSGSVWRGEGGGRWSQESREYGGDTGSEWESAGWWGWEETERMWAGSEDQLAPGGSSVTQFVNCCFLYPVTPRSPRCEHMAMVCVGAARNWGVGGERGDTGMSGRDRGSESELGAVRDRPGRKGETGKVG